MMCDVTSKMLKIPDLSKTRLTDILDMPRKGKITIKPYTKVTDHSDRREEIAKNVNWKGFVEFFILTFLTRNNEFGFIRVELQLICRQPLFDILQAPFQPVEGMRHILMCEMNI